MGKIFLILGILGVLLGGGIAIISLALPAMTRNITSSEAAIGVVAGVIVLALALIPAITGAIIMVVKRRKLKDHV